MTKEVSTAEPEAAHRPEMPLLQEGLTDGVYRYDPLPEKGPIEGMHWQAWPLEEGLSEGEGRLSRCHERCISIVMIKLMLVVVVLLSCCYPIVVTVMVVVV
jgi:hypothetical protein